MRIALVNPISRLNQGYHTIGTFIPQLGLQVLANLVPAGHSVDMIDEVFGPECTTQRVRKANYDLVAVTGYTSGATRAYEIAAQARAEGLPTIMGGPHASAMPDEAAKFFDSVAVGECDEIWPGIIADAAAGKLAKRYTGGMPQLVNGLGAARQDLDPINGKYDVSCIQTSRGCPVGCDFCSVTLFNGPTIRRRPVDEIIAEWNRTTKRFIFVVDDNFFGVSKRDTDWAKDFLRRLTVRGNKHRLWFSQTTVNMGDDAEGLSLAYKAGCRGMLVGFESINAENLRNFHKTLNTRQLPRYQELIDGFHRGGIALFGGFIIGGDADDEFSPADTLLEATRLGIDIIQITNLTPLPGTKLYARWLAEGKIHATNYPADWEKYTFTDTVFAPARMSAATLDDAVHEVRYLAAKRHWVWPRTLRSLLVNRSLTTALFVHGMNRGWKRMAKKQIPYDEKRFGPVRKTSERFRRLAKAFQARWRTSKATSAELPSPVPAQEK
jgi:radical SAM superfamily enzyme YgiQ (UPF0313 family)